ncbi:MAG: HD domain-containing phosphohydrolase [Nanoarchaeota archaeon]
MKNTEKKTKDNFKKIISEKKVQRYLKFLKKYDKETYEHSMRVSILCFYLSHKNSLPVKEIRKLCISGLFHDLGKIGIPKKVLYKAANLTKEEKEIINKHVRLGFLKLKNFDEDIKKIVISHHEYQKHAYPRKNNERRNNKRNKKDRRESNGELQKLSKILAVADIYDALINKRSYKKAVPKKEVEKILKKELTKDKYIKKIINHTKTLN